MTSLRVYATHGWIIKTRPFVRTSIINLTIKWVVSSLQVCSYYGRTQNCHAFIGLALLTKLQTCHTPLIIVVRQETYNETSKRFWCDILDIVHQTRAINFKLDSTCSNLAIKQATKTWNFLFCFSQILCSHFYLDDSLSWGSLHCNIVYFLSEFGLKSCWLRVWLAKKTIEFIR